MISPKLQRLFDRRRELDQVTGDNVIKFPAQRTRWPCERGVDPPRFLRRDCEGTESQSA